MALHGGGHLKFIKKRHKGSFGDSSAFVWGDVQASFLKKSAFCNFIPGSCVFSLMLLHYIEYYCDNPFVDDDNSYIVHKSPAAIWAVESQDRYCCDIGLALQTVNQQKSISYNYIKYTMPPIIYLIWNVILYPDHPQNCIDCSLAQNTPVNPFRQTDKLKLWWRPA